MPDRSLIPLTATPSVRERILWHPWEMVVSALNVVLGTLILIDLAVDPAILRHPLKALPVGMAYVIPTLFTAGGIMVLGALLWRSKHMRTEWRLERTGWFAGAVGWVCYAVTLAARWPDSLWTIALCMSLAAGSLLRLRAVGEVAARTREIVVQQQGEA